MQQTFENQYDVTVLGAGMVGLAAALGMARQGLKIAVVDVKAPALSWAPNSVEARVSALNVGSCKLLESLGVWPVIENSASTPLRQMQVWDAVGGGAIHFDSAEVGASQLGFIVENRALVRALWQALSVHAHVDFLVPAVPVHWQTRTLQLREQGTVTATLTFGADGGRSWLREAAHIPCAETTYGQQAIVAIVQTAQPHRHGAYQAFLKTGPVGLLPWLQPQQMALIWSAETARAEALMALGDAAFSMELTAVMGHALGSIQLQTPRQVLPLLQRHADYYVLPGLVLLGDAAHTIHPLAGQGVNLGFADVQAALDCIHRCKTQKQPLDHLKQWRRFERARRSENQLMIWTMQGFHQCFTAEGRVLPYLRSLGLNTVDRVGFLKRFFMQQAIS